MGRLNIEISGKLLFDVVLAVRITDINYGNHTGNDRLAGLLHEARLQWLVRNSLSELDIGGVGMIMSDLCIQFVRESFYGDQLTVELYSGETGNSSFELYYLVTDHNKNVVAKAKTGMVCYDYSLKKIAKVPLAFKLLLGN